MFIKSNQLKAARYRNDNDININTTNNNIGLYFSQDKNTCPMLHGKLLLLNDII